MSRIAINAVAVEIFDPAGRPTTFAQWPKGSRENKMMSNQLLSPAERLVAARCGVSAEAFARMKKKPINGRPLHGIDGGYGDDDDNSGKPYPAGPADGPPGSGPYPGKRASSPFPDASDDDDTDLMGLRINRPARVIFPQKQKVRE